ncbi:MAG: HTH-type transcriptional activator IlvY [Deltaproteobacteria bacterium]|jgi:LysR family positive regulator for ilvC|uniref:HTH-type transcriptional activator IlvY n=1 Tax=Hydrosulfovibrio ferrireducens TaxID=2934181 RepID=UPI0012279B74|nr:MAG: HTH-type transcriptional activator IlvY [Deltaproteobacteria bacterium]
MDMEELKLFRHLAESLHFGKTSRACHVTPSALTRTIQRIEAEVGERLFDRDNRSVRLTRAGEGLKQYAEESIERWKRLKESLAGEATLHGDISLYCSVTAAYSILPGILGRFRKACPEVHIKLQTGDAAQGVARLRNNEVEVIIDALPDKQASGLEFMPLTETPLVFIAPLAFPETVIRDGPEIDWRKTPLIVAEQGLSRERLDRWFAAKKILPNIYAQVAGNEAIIAMVSLGCGVGVVPLLVLEKSPLQEQIAVLEVFPRLAPFSLGVCTVKKNLRNPKIQAFWEIAGVR